MTDEPKEERDLSILDVMAVTRADFRFYGGELFFVLRSFHADDTNPQGFKTQILTKDTEGTWRIHDAAPLPPGVGLTATAALCNMLVPGNPDPVFRSSFPFHVPRDSFGDKQEHMPPPDEIFKYEGTTGIDEQFETAERELVTKVCFPNGWKLAVGGSIVD